MSSQPRDSLPLWTAHGSEIQTHMLLSPEARREPTEHPGVGVAGSPEPDRRAGTATPAPASTPVTLPRILLFVAAVAIAAVAVVLAAAVALQHGSDTDGAACDWGVLLPRLAAPWRPRARGQTHTQPLLRSEGADVTTSSGSSSSATDFRGGSSSGTGSSTASNTRAAAQGRRLRIQNRGSAVATLLLSGPEFGSLDEEQQQQQPSTSATADSPAAGAAATAAFANWTLSNANGSIRGLPITIPGYTLQVRVFVGGGGQLCVGGGRGLEGGPGGGDGAGPGRGVESMAGRGGDCKYQPKLKG